uniref:SH2 domain-containing protein n=1 Tax=Glossina palpalis gambiensis TaxID=67801 RepID=A0A1B0B1I4_9MUSC
MCWCLRVYWTVLYNLFIRFFNDIGDTLAPNSNDCHNSCCCCCCKHCCCCHSFHKSCCICHKHNRISDPSLNSDERRTISDIHLNMSTEHDYVIVDEIDANYLQIEKRKIETELYYRTVDRAIAEDVLTDREDGTCLVRPYKEADITIKYIVSIYCRQQFYHLYIRQICGKELYAIGQPKLNERLFTTPNEIIDFYKHHHLLCTNKQTTMSVILKPLIV